MGKAGVLLSCEHASNRVPKNYEGFLDSGISKLLKTHWAYDIGAKRVSDLWSKQLQEPVLEGKISRLLVDLNRRPTQKSLHHPKFRKRLRAQDRKDLMRDYYQPHYEKFENTLLRKLKFVDRVYHFAIHSFTPRFKSVSRRCDLAFLYDPKRALERQLATHIQKNLESQFSTFHIRRNYPYQGSKSGLVGQMRERYAKDKYVAIEVEVNQKHLSDQESFQKIRSLIEATASEVGQLKKN